MAKFDTKHLYMLNLGFGWHSLFDYFLDPPVESIKQYIADSESEIPDDLMEELQLILRRADRASNKS